MKHHIALRFSAVLPPLPTLSTLSTPANRLRRWTPLMMVFSPSSTLSPMPVQLWPPSPPPLPLRSKVSLIMVQPLIPLFVNRCLVWVQPSQRQDCLLENFLVCQPLVKGQSEVQTHQLVNSAPWSLANIAAIRAPNLQPQLRISILFRQVHPRERLPLRHCKRRRRKLAILSGCSNPNPHQQRDCPRYLNRISPCLLRTFSPTELVQLRLYLPSLTQHPFLFERNDQLRPTSKHIHLRQLHHPGFHRHFPKYGL